MERREKEMGRREAPPYKILGPPLHTSQLLKRKDLYHDTRSRD